MKRAQYNRTMLHGMLLLELVLAGCGGSNQTTGDKKALVWPSAPDEPRIQYIRTITGGDDYKSGFANITSTLTGGSKGNSFNRPFDICTNGNGHIWVSDAGTGLLSIDENAKEVKYLGENLPVNLTSVRGLAYGNHKIFAGSVDLGQVVVMHEDGSFSNLIGPKKKFVNPVDVVYDSARSRVLVVDNKAHKIYAYTESGDSLFSFGEWGSLDGCLNMPQSAAVDSAGNIYVDDAFNFRVQVFDSQGKFLRKFGSQGNVYGTFARPKGIALDSYNNIYVTDAIDNNFQIFNNQGDLLMFVGKGSPDNDGFQDPVSICIDQRNTIYVTDALNSRVQVFRLLKGN